MLICRATLVLALLGVVLTGCAPKPAQPRGMFDLSNMPSNTQSGAQTAIPDHTHAGGSGSFSSGIGGGGLGQMPGASTGGL